MSRSTRTITAGIAAFAALAPAAMAMPQDGPIRTSSLAGTTSAPRQDLRSPDARDAATPRQHLAGGHVALAPIKTTRIVHVDASSGFDWSDAVIGAGAAFGGLALVAGSGAVLRRRTVRHSVA
jgi:hypothetical protein